MIKNTKLVIFVGLLILLILSIILSKLFKSFNQEGFVSFLYDKQSMSQQVIPQYSNNQVVYKLYDNLYFDNNNGTLIEVESTEYNGNVDLTGNTISAITTMPRNNDFSLTYKLQSTSNVLPTPSDSISTSYKSAVFVSTNPYTDKYIAFYIPWGDSTYIHIINMSKNSHDSSYLFSKNKIVRIDDVKDIPLSFNTISVNITKDDVINTINQKYNRNTLEHINDYVLYDTSNGCLIVVKDLYSLDVYNRQNNIKTEITDNNSYEDTYAYDNVDYNVKIIPDNNSGCIILYISNGYFTIIVEIEKENDSVTIKSIKRFNEKGLVNGSGNNTQKAGVSNNNNVEDDDGLNNNNNTFDMDKYILKTQIVPPVCPAIPSCPACNVCSSSCTNCGGNGGSGTLSNKGNSIVTSDAISDIAREVGSTASHTLNTIKDIGDNTLNTTGNVISSSVNVIGNTTSNVFGTTFDAAENIGKKTLDTTGHIISGTLNTAENVGEKALDTTSNIITGTLNTVGNIGSNLFNYQTQNNQTQNNQTQNNQTQNNQIQNNQIQNNQTQNNQTQEVGNTYMDKYSYYGQIPQKPSSNFIPRTADFSSFGK